MNRRTGGRCTRPAKQYVKAGLVQLNGRVNGSTTAYLLTDEGAATLAAYRPLIDHGPVDRIGDAGDRGGVGPNHPRRKEPPMINPAAYLDSRPRRLITAIVFLTVVGVLGRHLFDTTWPATIMAIVLSLLIWAVLGCILARQHARAQLDAGMTPEIQRIWRAADSFEEVAARTAMWLRGQLPAQPSYYGPVDVDEEDVPGLAELLARCNEAGLLTTGSQAGFLGETYAEHWSQQAAVEGLIRAKDAHRLQPIIDKAGLRADFSGRGHVVTVYKDRDWTTFGIARDDLADEWTGYGICGPAAVVELQRAFPVVVYDPEAGRNDRLWPALAEFTRAEPAAVHDDDEPCRCHRSHAMVSPFHAGHCCFWPASQTCHADEEAQWEREDRRWHGARVAPAVDRSTS